MQAEVLNTTNGIQLNGPLLLSPQVHGDERGFFFESWNQRRWEDVLASHGQVAIAFVQDNHSRSSKGVLRGLHYQLRPHPQGKLVRCVLGEIFDVAVDLRVDSPTFGHWVAAHLSAENNHLLWLPVGFAHGFLTLSTHAEVLYKATGFWSRNCERAIRWDDRRLAITWPETVGLPQLSSKDEVAPLLSEALKGEELF